MRARLNDGNTYDLPRDDRRQRGEPARSAAASRSTTCRLSLIEDSIIVRNTGNIGAAAPMIVPSNCDGTLPTSGGGNVESGTDCGLERQNTTGGLATALADNGGQTPTLALPWTSDVHDFAAACTGTDQRDDAARPAGVCDPGAYEAHAATAVRDRTPRHADRHPDRGPPALHATPSRPPWSTGRSWSLRARGTVKVKVPGAKTFENLDVTEGIPVGSTVDTARAASRSRRSRSRARRPRPRPSTTGSSASPNRRASRT